MSKTRSFFERLTGSVPADDFDDSETGRIHPYVGEERRPQEKSTTPPADEGFMQEEAQLTIDMHQTSDAIIIEAMVAGVKPEDLDISITQDMVTINGKRSKSMEEKGDNYYYQELYWGSFSRSMLLPQEVDSEESEATIKNGLLTIRMPKLDKQKVQKIKVKHG
ncbi:MAG: Hsp20/alpha crystallin family protein [Candidatus Niyogibacteria bacterium]|nr:Hsp20/alpha crystallin family protein [Candidatus Niyogibacteria bacterium]